MAPVLALCCWFNYQPWQPPLQPPLCLPNRPPPPPFRRPRKPPPWQLPWQPAAVVNAAAAAGRGNTGAGPGAGAGAAPERVAGAGIVTEQPEPNRGSRCSSYRWQLPLSLWPRKPPPPAAAALVLVTRGSPPPWQLPFTQTRGSRHRGSLPVEPLDATATTVTARADLFHRTPKHLRPKPPQPGVPRCTSKKPPMTTRDSSRPQLRVRGYARIVLTCRCSPDG